MSHDDALDFVMGLIYILAWVAVFIAAGGVK
jgi:hypothetical protein